MRKDYETRSLRDRTARDIGSVRGVARGQEFDGVVFFIVGAMSRRYAVVPACVCSSPQEGDDFANPDLDRVVFSV